MSNMSYCRYNNTLIDLQDCFDAMQNEENEEHESDLSDSERRCKDELIELCKQISYDYGEDE